MSGAWRARKLVIASATYSPTRSGASWWGGRLGAESTRAAARRSCARHVDLANGGPSHGSASTVERRMQSRCCGLQSVRCG